ncbi:ThuA domain-containing protein [Streptomonospora nanhaiensis]|uniref:ThuA domain-containing protein n=1 Tax=Streptomonospora nanhaiensis TaxID=1323731 RepID=UPI001C3856AF|nr:ThuA domain-containing protein [Streptomonospora nanhaiensis]MBV2364584.1 ThuA domain-containing protein [Streptomonospora nanhaiensis]MBX9387506.1 ThuA domain-containing protein [Streptomonospora nanhaiensis]
MAARLLVFSRTTGYRHASIPAGVAALAALGRALGLEVEAAEDPAALRADRLADCAAVVFLSTSGTVLDGTARRALAAHVRGGGGFAGVHAAATAEPDWPFYADLLGARFTRHPEPQPALLRVEDRTHPATAHLGCTWARTDEWYDFDRDPRPGSHVLLSVDERTYRGGGMGADHPLAWYREVGRGRVFYTALGHEPEHYADPDFRAHLLGGLRHAVGAAEGPA